MTRPLAGVVVLDLTRFLSGPQATLLLAGLGAEVIKIDDPDGGDPAANAPPFAGAHGVAMERQSPADLGLAYLKRARNKKSITINLKSEQGRALFFDLVDSADVLVENFRTGVTTKLGIDWEQVRRRNPRLVYCSLTGYGNTGPDSNLKAYDLMVQAATGLMSITGEPGGGPVKAGSPLSDTIAGSHAALGVLSALMHRQGTGLGQFVDVSMSDCLVSMLFDEPLDCYARLGLDKQQGNRIMRFSPFNSYRSRDGWVVLGAATGPDWDRLMQAIGRDDLLAHPDMSRIGWRIMNNAEVDRVIQAWAIDHSTESIVALMNRHDIPCSPVRSVDDVLQWPHARERGSLGPLPHPQGLEVDAVAPGFPLKFSNAEAAWDQAAPMPGMHTDEVLGQRLGLSPDAIAALRAAGVV
jgi:CoA:oxalate CoA-transferase